MTDDGAEALQAARPLPEYTHPDRAFYIFGPEDGSLDKRIRAWCEDVVYVPTNGCMNLAATVNVVLELYVLLVTVYFWHVRQALYSPWMGCRSAPRLQPLPARLPAKCQGLRPASSSRAIAAPCRASSTFR